jgi:hypothetical protein
VIRAVVLALFLTFSVGHTSEKLPDLACNKLINFTLFNYDNLIADHFEGNGAYAHQLAQLFADVIPYPETVFLTILNDPQLNTELNAVQYMLKINQAVLQKTGFYFVHH